MFIKKEVGYLMVLLLLGILRGDLNGDWQRTLPPNLPNYFFINIPPAARGDFVHFLEARERAPRGCCR